VTISPSNRRSIRAISFKSSVASKGSGRIIWRRLNIRSCRVKVAARPTAAEISLIDSQISRSNQVSCSKQAGVPLDDRHDVIEVVRNPGGELADRIHLLQLAELSLQAEPLVTSRTVPTR
jgi:hypothetical protein